jgi:hypothetical protein
MTAMRKEWMALLAELEYLRALGEQLIRQTDELLREYAKLEPQPKIYKSTIAEHLEN